MDDLIRNRNAKFAAFQQEIDTLKENLSNHVKEKESLSTTLTVFKTESKEKESKYIDKEIILENQNKELENIIFLKDTFNAFDKTLLDEITKVQNVFNQMEAAVGQCSIDKSALEIQIKQLSIDNDQLLNQIMSQEFMHIAVNSVDILNVNKSCVDECNKCLELESELLKKKDFIEKDVYDKLSIKNSDLNAQLQEKVFSIAVLKNDLSKLKGKNVVDTAVSTPIATTIAPGMISQPSCSNKTNKVEDQSRSIKSRKNKKNCVVKTECNAYVMQSMSNTNSKSVCAICNECLFDANHDKCVLDYIHDVNVLSKSKHVKRKNKMRKVWKPTGKVFTKIGYSWKPTGRIFTIVGNRCPLTRITSTKEMPFKETTITPIITPSSELNVYSRKPKASRSVGSSSKVKIVESKTSNTKELNQSWGSTVSDVPSSSLNDCRLSKLLCGTVRFGNDHIAKIMGYRDYQMGNVTISQVYYVESALCYPNNDGKDLGKLKPKADIGIFVGYAPAKKAFRIYNKRTRLIIETVHVDFDELTAMASEQFSS
ncbi:hypothetical protein Tco_0044262 [Tanacetum coccineum]